MAPTLFRRCKYFLSLLFLILDALVGQAKKFTAHREKHFQCIPSLVVSLDIQASLKASYKVGDLAEAWYGCTNRQVELTSCIHAKHANKRRKLKHTNKE